MWHHEHFPRGPEFIINENLAPQWFPETLPATNCSFYQPWNTANCMNTSAFLDMPPPPYPIQPAAFYSAPIYATPYLPLVRHNFIGFGTRGFHLGISF
jgi:hypothetical protein